MAKNNLIFTQLRNPGKLTKVWEATSAHDGSYLGLVKFYAHWRKYVFFPSDGGVIFDSGCLQEIAQFLIDNKEARQ